MSNVIVASAIDWAETLVWPSVAVVVALLTIVAFATNAGKEFRRWLHDRLKGVEAFGIRVELTEQAARETRTTIDESFAVIRRRLRREFDDAVRREHLREALERLLEEVLPIVAHGNPALADLDFRATIYVEDALLRGYLYQLLDYYPRGSGTRGRFISVRFGIVGRAWRSSRNQVQGDIPVEAVELVELWGMTAQEARAAGQGRHSCLAVPLLAGPAPIGVLYMDATAINVFGDDENDALKRDAILAAILAQVDVVELTRRLGTIRERVLARAPQISVEPDVA